MPPSSSGGAAGQAAGRCWRWPGFGRARPAATRSISPVTWRMNCEALGREESGDAQRDDQRCAAAELVAEALVGLVDRIVLRDPHA